MRSPEQIIDRTVELKSIDRRALAARLIEAALGAVLLSAGLIKAYEPLDFARQISDYRIIAAPALVGVTAWVMIVVECALGAALLAGYRRRVSLVAAMILILAFLAAVAWAWATGATADCGCFGSWVKRTPAQAFIEDLVLLGAAVAAWSLSKQEPTRRRRLRALAVGVAMAVGLTLTALASRSPRQSADPAVRLLAQVPEQRPFASLAASDLPADLGRGSHLVALIDTGCDHCRASMPALNRLAGLSEGLPAVAALCPNTEDEAARFREKFGLRFPLGRVSRGDFLRLLERGQTPRLFLLRDGAVVKIWDGNVPTEAEIKAPPLP